VIPTALCSRIWRTVSRVSDRDQVIGSAVAQKAACSVATEAVVAHPGSIVVA
jgi:hypothetical protein